MHRHMRPAITLLLTVLALAAAQRALAQAPFTIGGVTAQPGTTVSGELQVPAGADAATVIPFSIVHGSNVTVARRTSA